MNRGNFTFKALIEACKANDVTDFIMVEEVRGEPGNTSVYVSGKQF